MNLTLESIQAEQSKLAAMIAKFAEQSITEYIFPRAEIALKLGEHYAGIILGKNGESSYHLILLAESRKSIRWKDALDWAESINGELPTRREQSLLFANLKEHSLNLSGTGQVSSTPLAQVTPGAMVSAAATRLTTSILASLEPVLSAD
jgi:hypothetical protein